MFSCIYNRKFTEGVMVMCDNEENYIMDYDDYCYECTGYGDDYYTDPETGESKCYCLECPYASWNRDGDD